jgi:hypothetical protein
VTLPATRATAALAPPASTPKQPLVAAAAKATLPSAAAVPAASLAPATVLQRYDLSALWQGKYDAEVTQTGPMDGFFGSDYQRIAFFFTEVRRDSLRPAVYWVKGKTRLRKTVSSFSGTISLASLTRLKAKGMTREDVGLLDVEDLQSVFTAEATFEFREQPQSGTTGIFKGTSYLDFYLDAEGKVHSAMSMMDASPVMPAKGAGVLYAGQWASYAAGPSKPVLVSGNVFITAPKALSHFSIGDRDPSFNPKYAKLGWNDYWANEEWWADSPQPSLSL